MGWKNFGAGSGDICTGDIKQTARAIAPSGWLICNGAPVSRITYASLFNIIGTTYGAGDGSTTFNLPDFRGKVGIGYDSAQTEFNLLGKTGGEKTHQLTVPEIPAHNHNNGAYNQLLKIDNTNTTGMTDNSNGEPRVNASGTMLSAGGNGAHNNLQPYITINYIIKY